MWWRLKSRSLLRVLMYHRFPGDPAVLERSLSQQFAYIRNNFHPVSLGEVSRCRRSGEPLPPCALVITIDDGYADFQNAWSLLKAFELPATLFVVSGFVNQKLWLWPDIVHFCVSRSPLKQLSLALPGQSDFKCRVTTAAERQTADRDLDALLLAMPDDTRREVITNLPEAAGVPLPGRIPQAYAPLSWEDLRRMASEGLEVGGHTETHPVLSRITSPERLQQEIQGSRAEIEERLGVPVQHFCYPNGQPSDISRASIDVVRNAGFLTASTAQRGLNRPSDSLLELRRIGVDPSMPDDTFEMELAGFRMG